jgi:hypothetical protein
MESSVTLAITGTKYIKNRQTFFFIYRLKRAKRDDVLATVSLTFLSNQIVQKVRPFTRRCVSASLTTSQNMGSFE